MRFISILKGIWKGINIFRKLVLNILFFFIFGFLLIAWTQYNVATAPQTVDYSDQALILELSGPIVEQESFQVPLNPLSGNMLNPQIPQEYVLYDVVETIRHAAGDEHITGLVLNLEAMPETNLTKLRYIAKAIIEFKQTGKPVIAYSGMYNQSQYYLASYANEVFLSPDGAVLIKGYSAYNLYYKDFLEKFNITPHVFRVGTYKSAVEPFLRNDMSEDAKASAAIWLSQLWNAYVEDVAHNRNISPNTLKPDMDTILELLEGVGGDLAQLSKNIGLVDDLKTRPQMAQYLVEKFGEGDLSSYRGITFNNYQATLEPQLNSSTDEIAIIVAKGVILDGEQPSGTVGGDTLSRQLQKARLDEQVKAVVLRIDSPGGSAFASEVIRQEIIALKESGKPVVVSMSSLAASGGYWIAMPADKIIAQPTSLTGSIGIFGLITTFEEGLNHFGVYSDGIGTSPFSGADPFTGINDGVSKAIQLNIEHGYKRFTTLVSQDRDLKIDDVERVAQGRVWTGADAMKRGLVDQMGDFDDAIQTAVQLAQLDEYQLKWFKQQPTTLELLIQQLSSGVQSTLGLNSLGLESLGLSNQNIPSGSMQSGSMQSAVKRLSNSAQLLNNLNDPKGYYSFCLPCQVE